VILVNPRYKQGLTEEYRCCREGHKRNGCFGRLLLIGKAMNLFTGVYKALYNKKFWKELIHLLSPHKFSI
jgi:hypothetical protein